MQKVHNCWFDLQIHTIITTIRSLPIKEKTVIDLCCGPGTLSHALLQADKQVNVIGIDANVFLLAIYRNVLSKYASNVRSENIDIRDDHAFDGIPKAHAIMSLTSLHWLSKENQRKLYNRIHAALFKGGIFINGDRVRLSSDFLRNIDYSTGEKIEGLTWNEFWQNIYDQYDIKDEIEEMESTIDVWEGTDHGYTSDFYLSSLKNSGFKEVDILFQAGDRIVYCGRK